MAGSVNQRIMDRAIRHGVFLERYKTSIANQVIGFMNDEMLPAILAQIQKRLSTFESRGFDLGPGSTNRLQLMDAAIKDVLQGGISEARGITRDNLVALAKSEGQFSAGLLNALTPTTVDFTLPSASLLRAVVTQRPFGGAMLTPWFDKLRRDTANNVMRAVRVGIATGQTTSDIVQALRGTRARGFKDGIFDVSRRSADALVRTATASVATQAREEVFRENEDLLDGEQWVATLDDRTCVECAALDGKVFQLDDGERPPVHPNCRCTMVPVVKSWKALGIKADELPESTRSALDGQVPESVTYGDWLEQQDYETQVDVLGQTRADLFATGQLEISDFVNDRGDLMTLDELRAAEPDAFTRKVSERLEVETSTKSPEPPARDTVDVVKSIVATLPQAVHDELSDWTVVVARDRRGFVKDLGVKSNTLGVTTLDKPAGDRRIIIFEYTGANRDKVNADLKKTVFHEAGHALDYNSMDKRDFYLSDTPEFRRAYKDDTERIAREKLLTPRQLYFAQDRMETFAEGTGALMTDPSELTSFQREFMDMFPNSMEVLRDKLEKFITSPPASEAVGPTAVAPPATATPAEAVGERRRIPEGSDQFWKSKAIRFGGETYTSAGWRTVDGQVEVITHSDIEQREGIPVERGTDGFIGWDGKFYTRREMDKLSGDYVAKYGVPDEPVNFSQTELGRLHAEMRTPEPMRWTPEYGAGYDALYGDAAPGEKLTASEEKYLKSYVAAEGAVQTNKALLEKSLDDVVDSKRVEATVSAIAKQPEYEGTAWRGSTLTADDVTRLQALADAKGTFSERMIVAATTDRDIAAGYRGLDNGVEIKILSATGRDLRPLDELRTVAGRTPNEEIAFLPGTSFKVQSFREVWLVAPSFSADARKVYEEPANGIRVEDAKGGNLPKGKVLIRQTYWELVLKEIV